MARGRANYFVLLIVMMCAFEVILSFVPFLGYVDMGGFFDVATVFLPVAAASVMLGPGAGAFVGLLLGLCRFAAMSFLAADPIIAPLFTPFAVSAAIPPSVWSLAIGLLPPVVAGILTGVVATKLDKLFRSSVLCFGISGLIGGFANWALTNLGIFLVYREVLPQVFDAHLSEIVLSAFRLNAAAESAAAALVCAVPAAFLYKKYISNG